MKCPQCHTEANKSKYENAHSISEIFYCKSCYGMFSLSPICFSYDEEFEEKKENMIKELEISHIKEKEFNNDKNNQ